MQARIYFTSTFTLMKENDAYSNIIQTVTFCLLIFCLLFSFVFILSDRKKKFTVHIENNSCVSLRTISDEWIHDMKKQVKKVQKTNSCVVNMSNSPIYWDASVLSCFWSLFHDFEAFLDFLKGRISRSDSDPPHIMTKSWNFPWLGCQDQ